MVQPYQRHEILQKRRMLMWCLLAFGAGGVNTTAFLACRSFVSHLTGTVTNIGSSAVEGLALDSLIILLCFVLGATSSAVLLFRLPPRGGLPPFWAPLVVVCALLVTLAILGTYGVFGPFGGTDAATAPILTLMSCLSFAMGMQNAAVATTTNQVIRTTHMTGSVSDLGVDLARAALSPARDERKAALHWSFLRTSKIGAFALGAAVAALLGLRFEYLTLLMPAATTLAVFALELARGPRPVAAAEAAPAQAHQAPVAAPIGSLADARS